MPRMAHLPKECVARSHPFEYMGVDYFGPLYVKEFSKVTGQIVERKVWVCLFTCFTVRAIHIELVEDMSTKEFLLCLHQFVARRGIPRLIISDNAQQFKATQTVLTKAWRDVVTDERIQDFLAKQDIKWKFIIKLAPWMGGLYERLVGLTKRALRKTIGSKLLTQRRLVTVLTEVEAVINSCPLVYIDDDINSSVTLSPTDFLLLHSNNVIPDLVEKSDREFDVTRASSSEQLLEICKCGQKHLNEFWKLWRHEYLSNL